MTVNKNIGATTNSLINFMVLTSDYVNNIDSARIGSATSSGKIYKNMKAKIKMPESAILRASLT
jgi:hypothetical protein